MTDTDELGKARSDPPEAVIAELEANGRLDADVAAATAPVRHRGPEWTASCPTLADARATARSRNGSGSFVRDLGCDPK